MAFRGGEPVHEPLPPNRQYMDPMYGRHFKQGSHTPFYRKPRNLYNSGQAICGGRGCLRACMISLENRGLLTNKFASKFRRRKPWSVDWSDFTGLPEGFYPVDQVTGKPQIPKGTPDKAPSKPAD